MDSLEVVQIRLVHEKKLYSDTAIKNVEDAVRVLGDELNTKFYKDIGTRIGDVLVLCQCPWIKKIIGNNSF